MSKQHSDCFTDSRVIETQVRDGYVYRWRICNKCERRFATEEVAHEEIARLRSIAQVQTEIFDLAESIYDRFGPKPDDLKNGAATQPRVSEPGAVATGSTTTHEPKTMRAAA